MPKPSLLLVSAPCIVEENRKKLPALAESFDLTCVTCRHSRSIGFDVNLRADPTQLPFHLIGLPTIGAVDTTTRYFFRGLRKVIASRKFDVILVESEPWAFVRWQAWLWKRIHQPRAIFGEFTWENAARPGARGWLLRICYRMAAASDDFVIAGNAAARRLFATVGFDPGRVLVAPQFGVDETAFRPSSGDQRRDARVREGFSPDAILIGFCGRFVGEKGVLDLVSAVEAAASRHPAVKIELALLGSGPLQPELDRLARERPWLRLLPPRSHTEVAGFMALLDVFVLPSKSRRPGGVAWEEQFGHVLIEAMACGVACIGSDSGAIPEVLGDVSLIFPAGDVSALGARLGKFAADPNLAAILGAELRGRALRQFTHAAVAGQWAAFLREHLASRAPQ